MSGPARRWELAAPSGILHHVRLPDGRLFFPRCSGAAGGRLPIRHGVQSGNSRRCWSSGRTSKNNYFFGKGQVFFFFFCFWGVFFLSFFARQHEKNWGVIFPRPTTPKRGIPALAAWAGLRLNSFVHSRPLPQRALRDPRPRRSRGRNNPAPARCSAQEQGPSPLARQQVFLVARRSWRG